MECNIRCTNISNLLRNSNAGRRTSVESLLIDMTGGNVTAGRMLFKLLSWWEIKPSVYKSHHDWYDDLRITRGMLRGTSEALHLAGVDVTREKKTTVAPTNHYQLNVLRFVRRLAELLGVAVRQVMKFLRDPRKQLRDDRAINCADSAQSLTTKTPPKTTTKERVCLTDNTTPGENGFQGSAESAPMTQEGRDLEPIPASALKLFTEQLARQLTNRHGAEKVALACYHASSAKNPAAWAMSALKDNYELSVLGYEITQNSSVQHSLQSPEEETETEEYPAEISEEKPSSVAPVSDVDAEAQTAWSITQAQLLHQFDRASGAHLRGARLLAAGDVWRVAVTSSYAQKMLSTALHRNAVRVLSDVVGRPVSVEFVTEAARV